MPAEDSPAILVARFLRANDYHETLSTFLREAGLPVDAGAGGSSKALTIEQVLQEKKAFDLSVNFEKLGVADEEKKWSVPAPSVPSVLQMPTATNILCVSVETLRLGSLNAPAQDVLVASTADRRLTFLQPTDTGFEVLDSHLSVQDSPILSFIGIGVRFLLCTSMSGRLVAFDTVTSMVVAERKDHSKYVVQVASFEIGDGLFWVATAAWDQKIFVYLVRISESKFSISEPIANIPQPSSPEALLFVRNPDEGDVYLLTSRRDSSFIFYHRLPAAQSLESAAQDLPASKQNLAPLSNTWIAFTPSSMKACPKDPTLIAVATSGVPHMKLLLVRLLFPSADRDDQTPPPAELPEQQRSGLDGPLASSTPAAQQARALLALQDRESSAIAIHCTTMAPQTQYSTPALVWRPDGSGVWVNGDDGVIRGIEGSSGKVVASLSTGHEAGSKIRCLWAGKIRDSASAAMRECLVSGGFDHRLITWAS